MQIQASTPSSIPDPDASDRQRLYDVIIRFRLRPMRRLVGQSAGGLWTTREGRGAEVSHRVLSGDDALDRVGRGVVVIDAIGRVLFVNGTAEWMLARAAGIEVTAGGFLRLTQTAQQSTFARFLVDSRCAQRQRHVAAHCGDTLTLRLHADSDAQSGQIVVAPLFDPPLTRLMQRTGPLHAVFVYEAPPRMPPTWAEAAR